MPLTTITITYSRTHRPETGDFRYTATASSTTYAPGWSAETLTAYGSTKTEARQTLVGLIDLATKTNGISDTVEVTT